MVFNRIQYDWSQGDTVSFSGGETAVVREGTEPIPIYLRGIWFDGTNDFLTISGLVLNLNFSLTLWIRLSNQKSFWTITDPILGTEIILQGDSNFLMFLTPGGVTAERDGTLVM